MLRLETTLIINNKYLSFLGAFSLRQTTSRRRQFPFCGTFANIMLKNSLFSYKIIGFSIFNSLFLSTCKIGQNDQVRRGTLWLP